MDIFRIQYWNKKAENTVNNITIRSEKHREVYKPLMWNSQFVLTMHSLHHILSWLSHRPSQLQFRWLVNDACHENAFAVCIIKGTRKKTCVVLIAQSKYNSIVVNLFKKRNFSGKSYTILEGKYNACNTFFISCICIRYNVINIF